MSTIQLRGDSEEQRAYGRPEGIDDETGIVTYWRGSLKMTNAAIERKGAFMSNE